MKTKLVSYATNLKSKIRFFVNRQNRAFLLINGGRQAFLLQFLLISTI